MKRNNLTRAAIALVLTLVLAFAAVPALAETTYTPIGGSTTVTKNLVVDSDANIPDITFAFTINRGTAASATASTIEILSSDVTASIGNAAFTNADTSSAIPGLPSDADPTNPTAGKKYAQKTVTVTFPENSFTKPGVYRYVINETNASLPGVTYDTNATRYLDVFVVADASNVLSVDSYVLRDAANTIGTDGSYTVDPDSKSNGYTNSITQYDFEFTKTIDGNQGDKNKSFTFTVSIAGANPGTYPIVATGVASAPTSITVQADGTATAEYSLTNGSSIKILGLNAGAACTVSENAQDYTPTHSIDSATAVSGNASGAVTIDGDHTVAFTNTRNGIIPTGIILTIAPFAIGLLVFGAVVVFLIAKKRRKYEEE